MDADALTTHGIVWVEDEYLVNMIEKSVIHFSE